MKKTYIAVLFFLGLNLFSCNNHMQTFTEKEKALIHAASSDAPFRVLLSTDSSDLELLRTSSSDITKILGNPDMAVLIARLKATLEYNNGVGIAAPQVGIRRNIFLFTKTEMPGTPIIVAINPKIISRADSTICFERDGCLSVPETSGTSIRYPWITVEYYNEKGELIREKLEGYSRETGFTAVIFQHEYDHLQGILFIDKLYAE